jgi:hypothetical protein
LCCFRRIEAFIYEPSLLARDDILLLQHKHTRLKQKATFGASSVTTYVVLSFYEPM